MKIFKNTKESEVNGTDFSRYDKVCGLVYKVFGVV